MNFLKEFMKLSLEEFEDYGKIAKKYTGVFPEKKKKNSLEISVQEFAVC